MHSAPAPHMGALPPGPNATDGGRGSAAQGLEPQIFRADRGLFRRFRDGDRVALDLVYRTYLSSVVRIARFGFRVPAKQVRVPGVASSEDLADVVQEVFARAFSKRTRASYDGLREYGPYLAQIARHALVDWLRVKGREVPLDPADLESAVGLEDDEIRICENDGFDPAMLRELEAYVADLPAELKGVYEKRFVLGLSQRDAAGRLGIGRQHLRTLEGRLKDGMTQRLLETETQGREQAEGIS